MSKSTRRTQILCRIDASAFVAIMLALLFVIIPSSILDFPRALVDLPSARTAVTMRGADREDSLNVAVQRDGKLYFQNGQVSPETLTSKLKQHVVRGTEPRVFLRADSRARYADVKSAIDSIHAAGIQQVGIVSNQKN